MTRRIVAIGIAAAGLLNAGSTAQAARPTIYIVAPGTIPRFIARPAAFGLFVPGAGGKVSRAGAIASLQRGKVEDALLGGKPGGRILADVMFGIPQRPVPRPIVYVELPPPGEHSNTRRYPVAFVGAGYRGILTSNATRIRGLVSVADIAPTLVALQEGHSPRIKASPDADATADLRWLDRRLTRVHHDRGWTYVEIILVILGLAAVAPAPAVLGGAAAIAAAMLLSSLGVTTFWVVIVAMLLLTVGLAFAGSARRRLIPFSVGLFLIGYLAVLTLSSEFQVPDTPDPHWQIVDAKGNTYLLQRLGVKNLGGLAKDKVNMTITLPAYIKDIAKVQIYCAWAEAVLGEASFSAAMMTTEQ